MTRLAAFFCLAAVSAVGVLLWLAAGLTTPVLPAEASTTPGSSEPPPVATTVVEPASAIAGEGPLTRTLVNELAETDPGESSEPASPPEMTRVVVVDQDNQPIPGAHVTWSGRDSKGTTTCDDRGSCHVDFPVTQSVMRFFVEAEGFFHARRDFSRAASIEIQLFRAVRLEGLVLEGDSSSPIPSANVSFIHSDCRGCKPEDTTSDELGAFVIPKIPHGQPLRITVKSARPTQTFRFAIREATDIGEVDLRVQPGLLLCGSVTDRTSGVALDGATVRVASHSVETDDTGAWCGDFLVHPRDQRLSITADAEGYCQLRGPVGQDSLVQGLPIALGLVPAASARVRVLSSDGVPVEGARVRFTADDIKRRDRRKTADVLKALSPGQRVELPAGWRVSHVRETVSKKTDAAGTASAGGFAPHSASLRATARHAELGWGTVKLDLLPGPGQIAQLEIRLEPPPSPTSETCVLTGRVTVNERPLAGTVILELAGQERRARVRSDGWYRFYGIEPGNWRLRYSAPYLGRGKSNALQDAERSVLVEAGRELRADIEASYTVAPISGRLVFDGPVEPKTVWAINKKQSFRLRTTSLADGTYSIDVPDVALDFRVSVGHAGLSHAKDQVRPGTRGVDFLLPRSGLFRHKVRHADTGREARRATILWRPTGTTTYRDLSSRRGPPDQHGWYEARLPRGTIDLLVRDDRNGYPGVEERNLLVSDDPPGHVVELIPGATVIFELDPADGPLNVDHRLRLNRLNAPAWPGSRSTRKLVTIPSDIVGASARVSGLAPGRWRLRMQPGNIVVTPRVIELTPNDSGAVKRVKLRWKPKD